LGYPINGMVLGLKGQRLRLGIGGVCEKTGLISPQNADAYAIFFLLTYATMYC